MKEWDAYLDYLTEWAEDHRGAGYYGCSPVCFDEWLDNECNEDEED